jgi:alcohol dehydrogenase class IV
MRPPDINYLTEIYFGLGSVDLVPELLQRLGIQRPILVTDAHLLALGLMASLRLDMPVTYSGTETNPTEANLGAALELYRQHGCDGVVAFGGGAVLDLAKLVSLMVGHPPPVEQYAIVHGGTARIGGSVAPILAVPTTAGSGSEVGRAALLTVGSGRKLGFLSAHLLPRVAVCDPRLTRSVPAYLTAATGMDAISHCVEAYCSPRANVVADAIALDGLSRGWRAIRRAVADGSDLAAREQMMQCSLMGGLAFQKGLGAVHSLSHPLGTSPLNLHHGTLNALFLAPVLRFNQAACSSRLDGVARAMGLPSGLDVPLAFERLVLDLGLPSRLRDLGVRQESLLELSQLAAIDHCSATNPRSFDERAAYQLYAEQW